jgi:hypothetical protein
LIQFSDARRRLARPLLALALIFLITLPAITARIYATDEIQYFSYLRSVWFDHDVSFENEYRRFYEAGPGTAAGFFETNLERQTETGLRINFGTIGSAILWAPFYGIADTWVALTGGTRDGYGYPYVLAVCLGSTIYGFAALALSMLAALQITGTAPWRAFAAAMAVWLGTPLLFYMFLAPVFAHATSAFSVALFVCVWLQVRRSWSIAGLAGLSAAAALMVMVREQDAAYLIGPVVDFAWQHAQGQRANLWRTAVACAAAIASFAIVYAPQALAYTALNGYPRPSRLVTRKMYWYSPHLFEVLFSPAHGYFFWTPVAVLATAGLMACGYRLAKTPAPGAPFAAALGVSLVLMYLSQIYLLGAIDSWSASGAFGQRRFIGATVITVIGLATVFDLAQRPIARSLVVLLVVLSIYWNLALMAMFGTGLMSRQQLDVRRNAYDAFVTIPRMAPELAHRYLFDRRSFYQRRS